MLNLIKRRTVKTNDAKKRHNSKTRKRMKADQSIYYENLEEKCLLAGITGNLATSEITVDGSSGVDEVLVTNSQDLTQINVSLLANGQQFQQSFNVADYTDIIINGLAGNDDLRLDSAVSLNALIVGGNGNDFLQGGAGNDVLNGGNGDDLLHGWGGDDILRGGAGNDQLAGYDGSDRLVGGLDSDLYHFHVAYNGLENDELYELNEAGVDELRFYTLSNDPVTVDLNLVNGNIVTHTNRTVFGTGSHIENLVGGEGNDFLAGNALNNQIVGGAGDDQLHGWAGDDTLNGGTGNDQLAGYDGSDQLIGGLDSDLYHFHDAYAGLENDSVVELNEAGVDELRFYTLSNDPLNVDLNIASGVFGSHTDRTITGNGQHIENLAGGAGNDFLAGNNLNNHITGGAGDDSLHGWGGDDTLLGSVGNDQLTGYDGSDQLVGGLDADLYHFHDAYNGVENDEIVELNEAGIDEIRFYTLANDPLDVDLSVSSGIFASHTDRTIVGSGLHIENLAGGSGNDSLTGNSLNNFIYGGDGNDHLRGEGGNDHLVGAAGHDAYVFTNATSQEYDTIDESTANGTDTIDFRSINTSVTADLDPASGNVISSHALRTLSFAGSESNVENAFGLDGEDIWVFRGQNQTAAVIDTGIAFTHTALGGALGINEKVVGGADLTEPNDNPFDDGTANNGHGTHVAGIIASTDAVNTGVAPDAELVGVRVFDDAGNGPDLAMLVDSLDWVLDNLDTFNHRITTVNLSLGSVSNFTGIDFTDPNLPADAVAINDRFGDLEDEGVFIAVSAGNDFQTFNSTPGLAFPAISPNVVPVASHGANNTMSDFSQRLGNVLVAPGEQINSTIPDQVSTTGPNGFGLRDGTSQASPFVAGASMLLREAFETVGVTNVTQDMLYETFRAHADVINDPITNADYDQINVEAALAAVLVDGFIPAPTIQTTSTGGPNPNYQFGNAVLHQTHSVLDTANDAARFSFTTDSTTANGELDDQGAPARKNLVPTVAQTSNALSGTDSNDLQKFDFFAEDRQFEVDELVSEELSDLSLDFETELSHASFG